MAKNGRNDQQFSPILKSASSNQNCKVLNFAVKSDISKLTISDEGIPCAPANSCNGLSTISDNQMKQGTFDESRSIVSFRSQTSAFSNILNEEHQNDFKVHHHIQKQQKRELLQAIAVK